MLRDDPPHMFTKTQQTITFFWNVSDFLQGQSRPIFLDARILKTCTEDQLIEVAESKITQESHAALWMLLLLRLAGVTTDQRLEVRNGMESIGIV